MDQKVRRTKKLGPSSSGLNIASERQWPGLCHDTGAHNSRSISTGSGSSSAALTAVAFQDHLVRNLNLSLSNQILTKPLIAPTKCKPVKSSVKAVVDTGRGISHKQTKKVQLENEYVLDPEPKPLSLAQIFGLVDAPTRPLSDKEWKTLKLKSNERDDSSLPCVICKENFGLQSQVLLSCSHVFHKNCLAAFERFTGKKTCPMCRKEQYQTRVIYEGARHCRIQSIIRIQSAWRGFVVRRWYRKLRQTVPPNDPMLRKKYYEDKLCSITERLVRSCRNDGIDDFLCEIDQSVKASRTVFERLDSSTPRFISDKEWETIFHKVNARGSEDCPICIMPLTKKTSPSQNSSLSIPNTEEKKSILLSCTHLFHSACLTAFEELSLLEEKVCPVCRSNYQKRYL